MSECCGGGVPLVRSFVAGTRDKGWTGDRGHGAGGVGDRDKGPAERA